LQCQVKRETISEISIVFLESSEEAFGEESQEFEDDHEPLCSDQPVKPAEKSNTLQEEHDEPESVQEEAFCKFEKYIFLIFLFFYPPLDESLALEGKTQVDITSILKKELWEREIKVLYLVK
jgi:hypothetical protein